MMRPCLGCGETFPTGELHNGRCQGCATGRERARPSRAERGYGPDHDAMRRRLASTLPCWCGYGCGRWLTRDSRWVAAHVVDGDPSKGYVVACESCNQRAKRMHGLKAIRVPLGAMRFTMFAIVLCYAITLV